MFKVMCISEGTPGGTVDSFGNKGVYVPPIQVGQIYTVVDEPDYQGMHYYELYEIQCNGWNVYWYNSSLFATIDSNIDELQLVSTKEECV